MAKSSVYFSQVLGDIVIQLTRQKLAEKHFQCCPDKQYITVKGENDRSMFILIDTKLKDMCDLF